MRVSMSITHSGKKGIGLRGKSLLGRSFLDEEERPVRLEVGWEKDGEGKPVDPSQARMQMSIHAKVVGLLLDQRGHDSDGKVSRSQSPFPPVLLSENREQAL